MVVPDDVIKAALFGDREVLQSWLDKGGDPNETFRFNIEWDYEDPDEPFDQDDLGQLEGNLLICSLCSNPHYRGDRSDQLRLLLSRGADPNLEVNLTVPLVQCEFPAEAIVLIDGGANVNGRDGNGTQLLHYAGVRANPLALAKVLVRRGADLSARSHGGRGDAEDFNTRNGNLEVANFLRDVKAAGGWKPYARAPRIELVRLRSLCARGRATPPRALERLFDCPSSATTKAKAARVARPLPKEVFWHVLSYWRTSRDD
jgi:hypothetical protein